MAKFLRASKFNPRLSVRTIIGSLLFFGLSACLPRGSDEAQLFGEEAMPTETDSFVSFDTLKSSVLRPARCIRCHREYDSEEGVRRDLIPGDPERSLIYQVVVSGAMPQGLPALSGAKRALLRSYIVGLALPQNPDPLPTPTPTPAPTPGPTLPPAASWRKIRFSVISRYCSACHNAKELPNYDRDTLGFLNKDDVVAEAKRIYRAMDRGRMPPPEDGLAPPPRALINTFKDWMDQGFPD